MKIVTSGLVFLDIDAYAGCIAYAELLRLKGENAIAFSSATMNDSITATIRSWDAPFTTAYKKQDGDTFVLIDVSEPENMEKLARIDEVEEVIDHHVGHEEFWHNLIGNKSTIEFIGAACTQVYEKWVEADLLHTISQTSARLLISGILDNTLNFKATITTSRDITAYEELLKIANLPSDWTAQYFSECQESILNDIRTALKNDTKSMKFHNIDVNSVAFGQLVIWNAEQAVTDYRPQFEQTMETFSKNWLVNIVGIDDGRSYFLGSNETVEEWATKILDVHFLDKLAIADRLWLRKEVAKQDLLFGVIG